MILPPGLVPIISVDIYRKFKPRATSPHRGAVNPLRLIAKIVFLRIFFSGFSLTRAREIVTCHCMSQNVFFEGEMMAQVFTPLTDDELLRRPPMILGIIRWRKYIGQPAGHYCSGFNIRVEQHTATQFQP
jgi:hypothetical protein